jgi:predicted dinucleotide-binding enzyme
MTEAVVIGTGVIGRAAARACAVPPIVLGAQRHFSTRKSSRNNTVRTLAERTVEELRNSPAAVST